MDYDQAYGEALRIHYNDWHTALLAPTDGLLLDFAIRQSSTIFELFANKDQALLAYKQLKQTPKPYYCGFRFSFQWTNGPTVAFFVSLQMHGPKA